MDKQASPLGHNSSILSCRKKRLRDIRRQNSHGPSTTTVMQHNTNTPQGTPRTDLTFYNWCDTVQWRRILAFLDLFIHFLNTAGILVTSSDSLFWCSISVHPEVLGARSEIRPHIFSGCQLNGQCPSLGGVGVLLTCMLECLNAWECFLTQIPAGRESNVRKERREYEISCRDEQGGHRCQLSGEGNG